MWEEVKGMQQRIPAGQTWTSASVHGTVIESTAKKFVWLVDWFCFVLFVSYYGSDQIHNRNIFQSCVSNRI